MNQTIGEDIQDALKAKPPISQKDAKELLEACKLLRDHIQRIENIPDGLTCEKVDAAIAKAEGRSC